MMESKSSSVTQSQAPIYHHDYDRSKLLSGEANGEANPKSYNARYSSGMVRSAKWLTVTIVVSVIISIPVIVLRTTLVSSDIQNLDQLKQVYQSQWKNLGFWISCWILVSWFSACVFHALIIFFPHIFRNVAKYINPAHARYWKVFYFMKWPVTILGCTICSYISYALIIYANDNLTANIDFSELPWDVFGNATITTQTDSNNVTYQIVTIDGFTYDDHNSKQTLFLAQDIIENVLFNIILWAALWFIEKCVILYISIHYNSRSNFGQLEYCKEVVQALVTLYDASIRLHPVNHYAFDTDDAAIIYSQPARREGRSGGRVRDISNMLDIGTQHFTSALGYVVNSSEESHWLVPRSSYAFVLRAIDNPTTARALANRIWMALASEERDVLTLEDIKKALAPQQFGYDDPEYLFRLVDESENGNIRQDEFVSTVVGIGKMRRNTYEAIADVSHALNTFDWVLCIILALSMVFFILVSWVPQIKALRDNIALVVVGGAFIVGRIGHEFFLGAIFLFFKHAFDVGDVVWLYNTPETTYVACVVKRLSLLYVVFERVDNNLEMQMPNDKLNTKRIENITRSGKNREQIDLSVDYETTFRDIQYLRNELTTFLGREDNRRDYRPNVDVRLKAIPDLQKIQLQVSFWHKSNWANEELRSARSSKFMCELLQTVRRIPINKPGGSGAKTGDEGKPSYMVAVSEEEAAVKRAAEKVKQKQKRFDFVKPADEGQPAKGPAQVDTSQLLEQELSPDEKLRQEEEKKRTAAEKAAKEEREKEETRLAEMAAMEQLNEIPLSERSRGSLNTARWQSNSKGVRSRRVY
ncbi:hypothetical protein BGW36DRAFT_383455 [Talaromyces proteolyticus]|uniref:EF-hand domain-containing protein n=1 Tax=Talaromyces proteolyticus TaxID=1131652 RepID=A0AAD4KME2_9EURO|nr:uncharacterized protein BGW36DRAFT_383455 [Talaromyces proteolyticus]KAH8693650.1 hypothetical protein BGW36DRAFT_383455 [Talaromyces proteolyticus]